jgi:hypothetical protein
VLRAPAWRTSLSPTGADATPAAVRDALRRYSPTLMGPPPVDLAAALRIADAGDVAEPDGPRARRVRARTAELTARTDLAIALGGDNSITYATVGRGAPPGSSRSTRTSTCATASPTARPCAASSTTDSTRRASCRSASPTSPTRPRTPGAPPTSASASSRSTTFVGAGRTT